MAEFREIEVIMPCFDADVVVKFPSGKKLVIQARPSNADVNYTGSLDVILPDDKTIVTCWVGDDMEAGAAVCDDPRQQHIRFAKQLVFELP